MIYELIMLRLKNGHRRGHILDWAKLEASAGRSLATLVGRGQKRPCRPFQFLGHNNNSY